MNTTARLVLALVLASMAAGAQQNATPPPAASARRSAAELEKLVEPIALYADPLLATILPASAYPLEIVQAARFVADTNNLARLDEQAWDENVKAVARVPLVIQKMNDDLKWTIALGEAFLAQDKELLDAVQRLRAKAQGAGTLRTTPQQTVVVTNLVVERVVEQRVTVVTNTIVQVQPANPEVVYVPSYNPAYVYYPPPGYVYDPYAPLLTFGVGIAVGAIIANECDWHHGGVYVGHHGAVVWGGGSYHHGDVDVDIDRNVNVNAINRGERPRPTNRPAASGTPKKWQPDQQRLQATSALGASGTARTLESRGWGTSGSARPSTGSVATRPSTGNVATRPSTGNVTTRPSTGNVTTRPSTGNVATRPSTGNVTTRPSTGNVSTRPTSTSSSRPSSTSRSSAFGGVSSGSSTRSYSSRGSASRSSYSGGRSGGRSGGGGRGGGRR